jgi:hypothetical protein
MTGLFHQQPDPSERIEYLLMFYFFHFFLLISRLAPGLGLASKNIAHYISIRIIAVNQIPDCALVFAFPAVRSGRAIATPFPQFVFVLIHSEIADRVGVAAIALNHPDLPIPFFCDFHFRPPIVFCVHAHNRVLELCQNRKKNKSQ